MRSPCEKVHTSASWRYRALTGLTFLAMCMFVVKPVWTSGSQAELEIDAAELLQGAIDLHLHVDPKPYGASIDTLKLARSLGLRAVLIKNHYEPTVDLAYLLRKELPGLQVFGGIDLNWISGGFNVEAVRHMVDVETNPGGSGTGIVWLGTLDAEHQVRANRQDRPFMSVSRDGEIVPEVREIITLIAEHGLVLATGHNSAEESLILLREGRNQGVEQMIFTHAVDSPIHASVQQLKEAAKLGAFIEFDFRNTLENGRWRAIRQVGPEFCFLSEFWTTFRPRSGEYEYANLGGVGAFLATMRDYGFSDQELTLLFKENTARAIGLDVL